MADQNLSAEASLFSAVETNLQSSGSVVRQRIIDKLTEDELASRTKVVLVGMDKLRTAKKTLQKIKPDVTNYNADGTAVPQFTKAKFDEKNKVEKQITDLANGLEQALSNTPDFKLLRKLVGGGEGESKEGSDTPTE